MELQSYLNSITLEDRKRYAERLGTSVEYVRQVAKGHKTPTSIERLLRMVIESGHQVTLKDLRPDLFVSHELSKDFMAAIRHQPSKLP